MSGRMTLGSLFVLAALIPGLCRAQSGYGYGPGAPPSPYQMPPQYQGQPPQYPGCPAPPGSPNTVYEQLPDDLGFLHDDTPLEVALKNVFRHSYYRGEFLLWSASSPGDVLLGGNAGQYVQSTVAQPVPPNTFIVPTGNPLTGNTASATEPSLSAFQIKNVNGYKGTIGLPIGPGNFEMSAFVLANRKNQFDGTSLITPEITANLLSVPPIPTTIPANFIGQPITVGGVQQYMLYTDAYLAVMQTSIWGSEANYVFDAANAGTGDWLTFSPLIGFRYLNYRESLSQSGNYQIVTDPTTTPATTASLPRSLYSQSNNNSYGPQFGVRAELAISKVVFGAEPKVMLGLNSYTASLSTINVPFDNPANNSNFNFHKQSTTFSPIGDLRVYSRINISQYAHAFVAYNVMWVGSISRPYDSIGYNVTADGHGLFNPSSTDTIIQGLSVGGELRF
jgi:hypothetical protein